MPKRVGKNVLELCDEVCGNRDYRCWVGGLQEAARRSDEDPKLIAFHFQDQHGLRVAKVNGVWWVLD